MLRIKYILGICSAEIECKTIQAVGTKESREYLPAFSLIKTHCCNSWLETTVWMDTNNAHSASPLGTNLHKGGNHAHIAAKPERTYVGFSLAVLLSQHNQVTAVDIVPEKVEKINNYISPTRNRLFYFLCVASDAVYLRITK